MTDIHDMRVRLREERGRAPVSSGGGGFRLPFGLVAGGAVILGFVVVMFTPKIYSVQRTAALPGFQEAKPRAEEPVRAVSTPAAPAPSAPAAVAQPARSDYAGKSADEAGRLADATCEHRTASAPQRGQAAVEAKLQCFLSEGTARFCEPGQRRKATADIINYFKGIEYTNAALVVAAKLPFRAPLTDAPQQAPTMLTPDPRVADAIEGLLRAGYLNKGSREDILANMPRDYKARFAPIVGMKVPCPEPPWWAVWR